MIIIPSLVRVAKAVAEMALHLRDSGTAQQHREAEQLKQWFRLQDTTQLCLMTSDSCWDSDRLEEEGAEKKDDDNPTTSGFDGMLVRVADALCAILFSLQSSVQPKLKIWAARLLKSYLECFLRRNRACVFDGVDHSDKNNCFKPVSKGILYRPVNVKYTS